MVRRKIIQRKEKEVLIAIIIGAILLIGGVYAATTIYEEKDFCEYPVTDWDVTLKDIVYDVDGDPFHIFTFESEDGVIGTNEFLWLESPLPGSTARSTTSAPKTYYPDTSVQTVEEALERAPWLAGYIPWETPDRPYILRQDTNTADDDTIRNMNYGGSCNSNYLNFESTDEERAQNCFVQEYDRLKYEYLCGGDYEFDFQGYFYFNVKGAYVIPREQYECLLDTDRDLEACGLLA